MQISILSIKAFKYYKKFENKDYCVIMSTSTDDKLKEVKRKNKLILYYDDNCKDFNKKMAHKIIKFTNKHKKQKIYCLCDAGISRSSAIACALNKYYNGDDYELWNDWHYKPNKHIYNTMINEFNNEVIKNEIK